MSASRFSPVGFRPDLNLGLDKFDLAADQAGFVGLKIAPVLEVGFSSGEYKVREIGDTLQQRDDLRASDGTYKSAELSFTKGSYTTQERGFEVRVDDNQAAIHKNWWNADLEAADTSRDVVLRNLNARVIAEAQTDRSQNTAAGTAWTNTTGSDPLTNVREARLAIIARSGIRPNALAMDYTSYEYLLDNTKIRDRCTNLGIIGSAVSPLLTRQILSVALDVEYIIVSGAMTNSANQPLAASLASMWTASSAVLFVYDDNPNMLKNCFMRTLHWAEDGGNIGTSFDRYYSDAKRSHVVRQRMQTKELVVNSTLAQRITGVA